METLCHFYLVIMATFTVTIPDHLLPGIVARMYDLQRTRDKPFANIDEFLAEYAVALAAGACSDYKVGPFYVGPVPPAWNQDGTPAQA